MNKKSTPQGFPLVLWAVIILNLLIGSISLTLTLTSKKEVVYVDAIRLLSKYNGMDAARAELTSRSKIWQANLDTLQKEVARAAIDYEKHKKTASEREGQLAEELLKAKQQQFVNYEQTVKDQYHQQDQEISTKILAKVNEYLKRYGQSKGYTIILAATHYGNIAYADKALDITDEVLAGLNNEYQKTGK